MSCDTCQDCEREWKPEEIPQLLLTVHSLSGYNTVGHLHGIMKGTAIKTLEAGYGLVKFANLNIAVSIVITEASNFIGACYGSKKKPSTYHQL